jgi:hypothetical protein
VKRSFDLQRNILRTAAARNHQLGPIKEFRRILYTQTHSGTCTVLPRHPDCVSQKPTRTDRRLASPALGGAGGGRARALGLCEPCAYLASEAATPPLNKKQRDKPGTAVLTFTVPWPRYLLFKGGEYVTQRMRISLRCSKTLLVDNPRSPPNHICFRRSRSEATP